MDENLIKRIGDEHLQADHKDGETFLHTDYNEFLSIFKTSINENYYDIQRITNGTLKVYNTTKLDGATLSRSVNSSLSSDDNTIPSSKQVKSYVDNYYNELSKKDEALSTTVSGAVSASNTAIDTANNASSDASNALDIATQASSQASRADFNADNAMNIATELSRTKADITEMEKRALITETGNKLSFSVDPSTYVLTINLLDKLNNVLSTGTVDLPIESLVMNASYDDETKSITLTLQNGEKVSFSVSALVEGLVSEDTFNQSIEQLKNALRTELTQTITDDANSSFNQNVQNKTDSFNENSSLKISEFNNNAAQKTLDYNNNCISKTNSFNQNSTQKVTEFNDNYTSKLNSFNSNADSRIEEFDTHADLALSSIPKQDAEGTDNTFTDGLESPLYDLGGDGKSEQVVTTGSNKLGLNNTTFTENGITVTLSDDGIVTVNGTTTGTVNSWNYHNRVKVLKYTPNTNYVFSAKYISGSVSGDNVIFNVRGGTTETDLRTYQLTTNLQVYDGNNYTNSTTKITPEAEGFITGFQIMANSGLTFNKLKVQLWYNEGNSADEYEPYTGGKPSPSSDYKQPINSIEGSVEFECRGKNLFNFKPYLKLGELNGVSSVCNDDYSITTKGTATANYIQILNPMDITDILVDGETYTIMQKNPNEKLYLQVTKTRDDGSSTYESLNSNTQNCRSFTVNKKVISKYNIGIQTNNTTVTGTIDITNFYQIVRGKYSSWIDFEIPKEPKQVTFNLNDEKLRSVGDVKDELVVDLETGDYYKVENIDEVVLDGSESWVLQSINEYGIANFKYTTGKEIYPINFNVISNYFASQNKSISQTKTNGIFIQWQNELYIRIEQEKASTVEEFKQWLSTHTTIVNYQLSTPTTKKLGTLSAEDLAKLKTFKGYNNVTVNTNLGLMNIRFTYGLDIKKYVDNKLSQLEQSITTNLLNIMPENVQAGIVDKEVNSLMEEI